MIAVSDAVLDRLQGARRKTHWRLLIEDADGVMRDYSDQGGIDWRESAEWGKNVDAALADGVIELKREADGLSIAPMIEGSSLNRDGADFFAPAVDMGRSLQVWVQVTDPEVQAVEADWVLVHDAIIQKVEWGSSVVKLPTLDRSSLLNKTIRTDLRYGTEVGTPVEDVMQALIDDVMGVGVFTLAVPTSPGFMVTEYPHGDATLVGKSVREALDDLSAAFAGYVDYRASLTLIVPDRTEPTALSAVATIGPEHYKALPQLGVDLDGIRNVVRVTYRDGATGEVAFVEATHAGSIAAYGEHYIGITEGDTSPIDTAPEAQDMADRVRDDLAVQRVQQQVVDWFFYPVELGDHITWKANGKHYDTDQHWAVTGYRHRLSQGRRETTFDVRGAASGGYRRWLRRAAQPPIEPPEEPAPGLPFKLSVEPTQVTNTGKVTVGIHDPELAVTAVEFSRNAGNGWTSYGTLWDTSTGVAGTDATLARSESFALSAKHTYGFKVRVSYTDLNDVARTHVESVALDLDMVAEITDIIPGIDSEGALYVGLVGDEDTANMYIRVTTDGTTPTDPTSASNDGTVGGRSGRVAAVGKTVVSGDTVTVKAIGYDTDGGAGPIQSTTWTVPHEPDAEKNPPSLLSVECHVGDDGTNDTYTLTWTYNDAVTASFNVFARYYRNGVEASSTTTTTATNGTAGIVEATGDGISDTHWAIVQLLDASDNAIQTIETFHVPSTTP